MQITGDKCYISTNVRQMELRYVQSFAKTSGGRSCLFEFCIEII